MGGPTLAIDTATTVCSAALADGDRLVGRVYEDVGRGHAERLVPMVASLTDTYGPPARILVDCGPGSFTGIRVGLAAAIGMGIGWGVPVAGYASLALIAAAAFDEDPMLAACGIAIAGGHGELFVQRYTARPFAAASALASLPPAAAAIAIADPVVAGSAAENLVTARGTGEARTRLPDAAFARLLPDECILPPRPIYGRAPDAKPRAA